MSYATKPLALDETLVRVAETLEGGSTPIETRFDNVDGSIAPLFDEAITYNVDDLVMYQDKLYKCTTSHTGAWDVADFTTAIIVEENNSSVIGSNAGGHNSIYRGQSLGTSVTADQYAAIQAGTFDDMFIGDYWTIGGVVYRIAAFDYWLNIYETSTTLCTDHHVVLVPDTCFGLQKMNDTATTTGGYVGSKMYTTYLNDAKTTINSAFGSHILSHKEVFVNSVTSGVPTSISMYDSTVDLMNERMVYGGIMYEVANTGENGLERGTYDKSQLPLFALNPSHILGWYGGTQADWWLRSVTSNSTFAYVNVSGSPASGAANVTDYVRPAFAIYSPL